MKTKQILKTLFPKTVLALQKEGLDNWLDYKLKNGNKYEDIDMVDIYTDDEGNNYQIKITFKK